MHGVQGPYAHAAFVEELGQDPACLLNAIPKDDFNGHHADPNLTYAVDLTAKMGLDTEACLSRPRSRRPPLVPQQMAMQTAT